jgi:hypothetical protein
LVAFRQGFQRNGSINDGDSGSVQTFKSLTRKPDRRVLNCSHKPVGSVHAEQYAASSSVIPNFQPVAVQFERTQLIGTGEIRRKTAFHMVGHHGFCMSTV